MCGRTWPPATSDLQVFRFPDADRAGRVRRLWAGRRSWPAETSKRPAAPTPMTRRKSSTTCSTPASATRSTPCARCRPRPTGIATPSSPWASRRACAARATPGKRSPGLPGGAMPTSPRRCSPDHAEMDAPLRKLKVGHIAQVVAAGLVGTLSRRRTRCSRAGRSRPRSRSRTRSIPPARRSRTCTRRTSRTSPPRATSTSPRRTRSPGSSRSTPTSSGSTSRRSFTPTAPTYRTGSGRSWTRCRWTSSSPAGSGSACSRIRSVSAVALTRSIARYGVAHLVGRDGLWEDRTSLAAVELMGAYPALICLPAAPGRGLGRGSRGRDPRPQGGHRRVASPSWRAWSNRYQPGDKLAVIVSHSPDQDGTGLDAGLQRQRPSLSAIERTSASWSPRRCSSAPAAASRWSMAATSAAGAAWKRSR